MPLWQEYIENFHSALLKKTGAGIQGIGDITIINVGEYKGVLIPFRIEAGDYGEYAAFAYWGTGERTYECTLASTGDDWAFAYNDMLESLDLFETLK